VQSGNFKMLTLPFDFLSQICVNSNFGHANSLT